MIAMLRLRRLSRDTYGRASGAFAGDDSRKIADKI